MINRSLNDMPALSKPEPMQVENDQTHAKQGHSTEHLWLAIRLKQLPLLALKDQQKTSKGLGIIDKNMLCSLDSNARNKGIQAGMSLATAQMLDDIEYLERDKKTEKELLKQLCDSFYSITPHIDKCKTPEHSGVFDSGILLEVSSCLNLFGSSQHILDKAKTILSSYNILQEQGIYCAWGHTKEAAWLLSFQQSSQESLHRQGFIRQLKKLPTDFLFDFSKDVSRLKKMGFYTLGQLFDKERSLEKLSHRVSSAFIYYLKTAFALDSSLDQNMLFSTPKPDYLPESDYLASEDYDQPINDIALIKIHMQKLLENMSQHLVRHQLQTSEFHWQLFDIYNTKEVFTIKLNSFHRHVGQALDISMIHLENKGLPFEVNRLEILCQKMLHFTGASKTLEYRRYYWGA